MDFFLQERRASVPMDFADLEKLVAAGVTLMDEAKVPKGAVITNLIVKGRPAVAVEYTYLPPGQSLTTRKPETVTGLVLELGGVEVRLFSLSGIKRGSRGTWVPFEALSVDELARIAGTLAPIR